MSLVAALMPDERRPGSAVPDQGPDVGMLQVPNERIPGSVVPAQGPVVPAQGFDYPK